MEEPHEEKKGFHSQQRGFHAQKWLFGSVANNELNLSMLPEKLTNVDFCFSLHVIPMNARYGNTKSNCLRIEKNSGINYSTCLFSWNVVSRVVVKMKTMLQYNNNNMACNELGVLSLAKSPSYEICRWGWRICFEFLHSPTNEHTLTGNPSLSYFVAPDC